MSPKPQKRVPVGTPIRVYSGLLYQGPQRRSENRRQVEDRRAAGQRPEDFKWGDDNSWGRRKRNTDRKLRPSDVGRLMRQEWIDFARIIHEFDPNGGMVFPWNKGPSSFIRDVEQWPTKPIDPAYGPWGLALQKFLEVYGKGAAGKLFEGTTPNAEYHIRWYPTYTLWNSNRRKLDRRTQKERRTKPGIIKELKKKD